jgi:hypothetical protein
MTQDDDGARGRPETPPGPGSASPAPAPWAAPGGAPGGPAADWAAPGGGTPSAPGHGGGYPPPPPGGNPPGSPQGGYAHPGHAPGGYPPPGGPHGPYGGPPPHGHRPGAPWGAPRPGIVALRPLTLGDIFNGAFGYVRGNPKAALGLTAIITAVVSLLPALSAGTMIGDLTSWEERLLADPEAVADFPLSPATLAAQFGGMLVGFVGSAVLTGLLATVVGLAVLGRKVSIGEAWRAVVPRLGAVFGVAALLLLAGVGSFSILGLVIVLVAVIGTAGSVGLAVLTGFAGGIAWAAGSVWVYVRLSMAMPVTVLERIGAGAALARSWRLTRGSWWRVFGILLLASVLGGVVSSMLSGPFSLLGGFSELLIDNAAVAATVYGAAVFLGSVVGGLVTTPFVTGVTTLLYVDLRMRREGLDLRLGAAAQSGSDPGPEIYLPEPVGPAAPTGPYGTAG